VQAFTQSFFCAQIQEPALRVFDGATIGEYLRGNDAAPARRVRVTIARRGIDRG
jgi:hypothetical protein